jgi:DNA-binding transcriptional ArsR family regulator
MPYRTLVAKELGDFLGVLSHPHRIRIVVELRDEERGVNALQAILGISHSGVSQHLSVLRAHRIVAERREGRHVYYRLRQPELARWLLEAVTFLEGTSVQSESIRTAIEHVKTEWAMPPA